MTADRVFERARGLGGAIVRFGEEMMHGERTAANPAWLLGSREVPTVAVPARRCALGLSRADPRPRPGALRLGAAAGAGPQETIFSALA